MRVGSATPYLDLTVKLNADGIPLTYGEVLLVSDWYEHKGGRTPQATAARNRAYEFPGAIPRILEVLNAEMERRAQWCTA